MIDILTKQESQKLKNFEIYYTLHMCTEHVKCHAKRNCFITLAEVEPRRRVYFQTCFQFHRMEQLPRQQ